VSAGKAIRVTNHRKDITPRHRRIGRHVVLPNPLELRGLDGREEGLHGVVRRYKESLETIMDEGVHAAPTASNHGKARAARLQRCYSETFIDRWLNVDMSRFEDVSDAISIHSTGKSHWHSARPALPRSTMWTVANDGEVCTWPLLGDGPKQPYQSTQSFARGQAHNGDDMQWFIRWGRNICSPRQWINPIGCDRDRPDFGEGTRYRPGCDAADSGDMDSRPIQ
jgi:hypothetical protein